MLRATGPAHRLASTSREVSSPSSIASLVSVLVAADEAVVLRAARALWDLAADNGISRAAITSAGGIELLVGVLRDHSEGTQEAAAAVLWHLTAEEDATINASAFAAASAMPHMALLHAPDDVASQRGVSAARRAEVTATGGIPPLVALLASGSPGLQQVAAGVLSNVCISHPVTRTEVVEAGGVPPLVALLLGGAGADVQKFAATALLHLSIDSSVNRSAIVAAGGLPPLIALLDSRNVGVQGAAAAALGNLVEGSGPNKEEVHAHALESCATSTRPFATLAAPRCLRVHVTSVPCLFLCR